MSVRGVAAAAANARSKEMGFAVEPRRCGERDWSAASGLHWRYRRGLHQARVWRHVAKSWRTPRCPESVEPAA